jgi:malonyl-CoA/methylmalonyl-CoA synthetase
MNLHDLFAISARRFPGKPAISFAVPEAMGETAAETSYRELLAAAERLAAGLRRRGLRKGDRVAILLGNRPELAVAWLAALRLGLAGVPINLAYRRRELAHLLADSGARLLVTEEALLSRLDELDAAERAGLADVLTVERLGEIEEEGSPADPGEPVDPDDLAMLLYTSGTTGRSKGAMISHGNVLATVTGLLAAWAWEPTDELLLTLPLFHTHGLVVGLFCALGAGATVRLRPRFEAGAVVEELAGGGPTLFFGVPTMYVRLVEELRRRGGLRKEGRMRLFCSGSAPLSPETFAAFRELTGHDILERYGMTETGMSLSNPYAGERRPGTVGTPLPGVSARIADEEGRDLPDGEAGELLVRGSHVFRGYWRDPGKTAASFVADDLGRPWFRTGDLARRDPETGVYTLLGRRHELILSGGFNVYPREIEEVLLGFPGVREAAVAGRPHPEWGEVPVAFLVVDGPLDEAALIAWCKEQIAGFKVPREIRRLDALPRNALGKVQKHLLPREPREE